MHILTHICIFLHISAYFTGSIPASPVPGHSGSCKLFIASNISLRQDSRRAGGRRQRQPAASAAPWGSQRPSAASEAGGRRCASTPLFHSFIPVSTSKPGGCREFGSETFASKNKF